MLALRICTTVCYHLTKRDNWFIILPYISSPRVNRTFMRKLVKNSYQTILTYFLGAQKNRLNETVLLSTHNVCFG